MGEKVVRQHAVETAKRAETQQAGPFVVGLDRGYARSRHRQQERHFEVIAGKVVDAEGTQHRLAFFRDGQTASADFAPGFARTVRQASLTRAVALAAGRVLFVLVALPFFVDPAQRADRLTAGNADWPISTWPGTSPATSPGIHGHAYHGIPHSKIFPVIITMSPKTITE